MSRFIILFLFLIPLSLFSANKEHKGVVIVYKKGLANIDNKDIRLGIEILLQEMLESEDISFKAEFTDDFEKAISDFQSVKADFLSMDFVYYMQEYDSLSPYVQDTWILITRKKNTFRRFYLLVNKKSGINSLAELKNKRIGLLESDSLQELYINTLLLENQGLKSKKYFKEKIYYPKFSRALLKLFFNKIDACIVSENTWDIAVELNPQIAKSLKFIDKSPDIFPPVSITLTHKKSPYFSKLYKDFSLKLENNSHAKQIFDMYQIVESVKVSKKDLAPIFKYYKHYLELEKKNYAK